jgi:hypothetical protein
MPSDMPFEKAELRRRALRYLQEHTTMTLATVGPEGPWAAGLFYVSEEFDLYWLSNPESRHSRNLAYEPRVAVTIHEDYRDWRIIQGLQMEGSAREIGPPEWTGRPMALYLAKYPFLKDPPLPLRHALTRMRVYRFQPTRIYFIDNTRGVGVREEVPVTS